MNGVDGFAALGDMNFGHQTGLAADQLPDFIVGDEIGRHIDPVAIPPNRDKRIVQTNILIEQLEHRFFGNQRLHVDERHIALFGQGGDQIVFGDKPQAFEQLAQHLLGDFLLLQGKLDVTLSDQSLFF